MGHEKLCIFCEHFRWKRPYSLYSEATGPIPFDGESSCRRGHFKDIDPEDEKDFREIILTGKNCDDYQQVQG